MASPKLQLDIVLNDAEAANSIKDIKKSMQDLKSLASEFGEGSAEFEKVTAAAGDLKDRLEDVNQAINAKKGTGFEKLGGELSILKDKFSTLDFKGVNESIGRLGTSFAKISFKDVTDGIKGFGSVLGSIGKALLANPLFLIAGAVIAIGAALYALKDKVKIIGDAFAFLGNIIKSVVQFFKDLSDAIGLSSFAAEEAAQKQLDAAKKAQAGIGERYDFEIAKAKAAGKNTLDLENQKSKAVQDNIKEQILALSKFFVLNGKFNEEQLKALEELKTAYKTSIKETTLAQITADKEKSDKQKEAGKKVVEENAKILKQIQDLTDASIKDADDRAVAVLRTNYNREVEAINKSKANQELKNADLIALQIKFNQDLQAIEDKKTADAFEILSAEQDKKVEDDKAAVELEQRKTDEAFQLLSDQADQEDEFRADKLAKDKAAAQEKTDAEFSIAQQGLQGIQSLTDLYFTIKSANTKKGSAEEEAAARKQFNINKGLQIASTTITGIQNGIKAFGAGVAAATQIGYPLAAPAFGAAYAAISAIGTIAAIAKISSTQFGSTGGGGASAGATTPSVPTPNAPVQNQAQPARLNDFSLGIAGNSNNASAAKSTEVRAVVLESDITKTQKKVEGYKLNSEL